MRMKAIKKEERHKLGMLNAGAAALFDQFSFT